MLYELVNSITLEKIGGPILVMSNLNFPDLCCCFETSNILKVAYRDDDRCIITTKTFYLGGVNLHLFQLNELVWVGKRLKHYHYR